MMKARLSPSALVMVGALLAAPALAASPSVAPPAEVMAAAQEGLATLVRANGDQLGRLGIPTQADADRATLGEGVEVFTISPTALLDETTPPDLAKLATPANQWQFIVNVHGAAKALLTVALMNGKWTPVSLGAAELAAEVSAVSASWPRSANYQHRLVRVHQARAEFMHVTRPGATAGVVPMGSFNAAAGPARKSFDPRDLRDTGESLSRLRPAVRRGLERHP